LITSNAHDSVRAGADEREADTVLVVSDRRSSLACGMVAVLEMYGLVGVSVRSYRELLESPDKPEGTVLLASPGDWAPFRGLLGEIVRSAACVVVEGPIDRDTARLFGAEVGESEFDLESLRGVIVDQAMSDRIAQLLEGLRTRSYVTMDSVRFRTGRDDDHAIAEVCGDRICRSASSFRPAVVNDGRFDLLAQGERPNEILMFRRGHVVVASFPVLELIARRTAVPRLDVPASRIEGERNGEDLELLLIFSIAHARRCSGRPLVTVEPWPAGTKLVLTVRHDVDRHVASPDWERLLDWGLRTGVRASWYFLQETADPSRIADVARIGHEVGYHYTNLPARGETEYAAVRSAALRAGTEIVGACCHGGNYRGMTDLLWLERKGLRYAESLGRCALFPYRPIGVGENGAFVSDVPVSARHLSVDRRLTPPEADFSYGCRTMSARVRTRSHVIVMNHPDINFEAFTRAVDVYRGAGRQWWTQREVIEWWSATHFAPAALSAARSDGAVEVALRHVSKLLPELRVWCERELLSTDGREDDAFGERHTVTSCDRPIRFATSPEVRRIGRA